MGSEYQVHLFRREDGRDILLVKVEGFGADSPDAEQRLVEDITSEFRRQIMVRAQVEIVEYGTLPRTERKSKRVFDHRTGD